jgi:hypothetical protein
VTVTPIKPHDVLAIAAAQLSRAAPNTWAEFLKAFEAYACIYKDACVQAPADQVLKAQGKAQGCVELSSLFINAIKTANELAAKQK